MTELLHEDTLLSPLDRGAQLIRDTVKNLPGSPGIYRMTASNDEVLYVGKAKCLKKRVISYALVHKLPNRLKRMVSQLSYIEVVTTHTEVEALLLESNLIKQLQPRYNILLKDDKSFPYILITKDHTFPRIAKHRGSQFLKGNYYGPFASIPAVDEAILTLQKLFRIRNCSNSYFAQRNRPCLQYHIKRCTAPCVEKITQANYEQSIKQANNFLLGKTDQVQRELAEKMSEASNNLNYEEAANYRDRIRLLTQIQARQRINISGVREADIIALATLEGITCVQIFFFRHGRNFGTDSIFLTHDSETTPEARISAFIMQFYQERTPPSLILLSHEPEEFNLIKTALKEQSKKTIKWELPKLGLKKELMDHALSNARGTLERKQSEKASMNKIFTQLVELFDLPKMPERIEIYDNSHIQGKHAYGVMVVATQQGFEKKSYRKFAIKTLQDKSDDYGMMREVMQRRFAHCDDWTLPDLLLIDGGGGQLSTVLQVLKEEGFEDIPTVGISKGPERNAGKEKFHMPGKDAFALPENSALLHFLQRLRDEAHRFAIGTHRYKREKIISKSKIDLIPGIGPSRKKKLLQHFGSAQGISRAALADLQLVEGINKAVAQKIYDHFHEK